MQVTAAPALRQVLDRDEADNVPVHGCCLVKACFVI